MDFIYVLIRKLLVGLVRTTVVVSADFAARARDGVPRLLGSKRVATRVLVVRVDKIGDYVLWLDAASRLRSIYPRGEYELTLLCDKALAGLAEGGALFDRVWAFDKSRFKEAAYHFRLLARLRMARFNVAIQPTFSRDYAGDSLVLHCGAAERIGSAGDGANIDPDRKRLNDRKYTRLVPADPMPMMELKRNAEFMRGLGLLDFCASLPELCLRGPSGLDLPQGDYYVLFPGASWYRKKWPLSNFQELAARIHEKTGWTGVVCGDDMERWMGDTLVRESGVPVQNLAGRTNLEELAAAIKGARVLVCNDTSAVHIAAAVSTPSVCILGGGHFGRFLPYRLEAETDRPLPVPVHVEMDCFGCNWECKYAIKRGDPAPCIARVTVDMTWDAVTKVLDGSGDGRRR